jgi:transcriptional/translational regulatory protein YebC/TACO1
MADTRTEFVPDSRMLAPVRVVFHKHDQRGMLTQTGVVHCMLAHNGNLHVKSSSFDVWEEVDFALQ